LRVLLSLIFKYLSRLHLVIFIQLVDRVCIVSLVILRWYLRILIWVLRSTLMEGWLLGMRSIRRCLSRWTAWMTWHLALVVVFTIIIIAIFIIITWHFRIFITLIIQVILILLKELINIARLLVLSLVIIFRMIQVQLDIVFFLFPL
jgi:hypothetical protein